MYGVAGVLGTAVPQVSLGRDRYGGQPSPMRIQSTINHALEDIISAL